MRKIKKIFIGLGLCLGILGCTNAAESMVVVSTSKAKAEKIVERMSDREKLGQLMMVDFRNWNKRPFTAMNSEVKKLSVIMSWGGLSYSGKIW